MSSHHDTISDIAASLWIVADELEGENKASARDQARQFHTYPDSFTEEQALLILGHYENLIGG